jgi:hypothetical protein
MTVPLPGGRADELLVHMSQCGICKAAKINNLPAYCDVGRKLIRLTLSERHGPVDDERGTQGSAEQGA